MRPNELKFIGPLVDMINKPENGFKKDEHLFVTPHKHVYETLYNNNNVVLDETRINLVNKYAPECKWIISHGIPGIKEVLLTKRRFLHKIVWRTWGGFHQKYNYNKDSFAMSIVHRIADYGFKLYLNNTFGKGIIGVANSVDIIDLREWIKETPLIPMPYIGSNQYPILKEMSSKKKEETQVLKILLGHQGTEAENHLTIIKQLQRFDSQKISIVVPLSYGTKTYIEWLISQIEKLQMSNVILLTDFLSFEDYAKLLNSIDLAILDEKSSMALGNLSILLFFEKKLMLNRNGILKKVLDLNKIPHMCTDELSSVTIEELRKPISYDGKNNDIVLHDYSYYLNQWRFFLSFLDEREHQNRS